MRAKGALYPLLAYVPLTGVISLFKLCPLRIFLFFFFLFLFFCKALVLNGLDAQSDLSELFLGQWLSETWTPGGP